MKKNICIFIFVIFSTSAFAEIIELIPPIEGAKSYEILLFSHSAKKNYKFTLKSTRIKTDKIPSGDYDYQLRYVDEKGSWSDWSEKGQLKIKKKKPKIITTKYNFPMIFSLGYTSLNINLKSSGGRVKNTESLLNGKFLIAKDSYKLRFNYHTNSDFSRLDMSLVKDIMRNISVGGSFWMVNYSTESETGSDVMANLSQGFGEINYFYDWKRFSFLLRSGLSISFNYFVKPELTYKLPFWEKYRPTLGFGYEVSRIDQSNVIYNMTGSGVAISSNLSVNF